MTNKKGETMKDKEGNDRIQRDIMTFRIASSKQIGTGVWDSPGRPGLKAFEEVAQSLDVIWDRMIRDLVK
jgi:hypothetical protein